MSDESNALVVTSALVPAIVFAPGGVDAILNQIKAEVAAVDIDISRREADKRHRATVNNEILADLTTATGMTEPAAKAVITAIVSGQVRHTRVSY